MQQKLLYLRINNKLTKQKLTMELELKYICPYMPYRLKFKHDVDVWNLTGTSRNSKGKYFIHGQYDLYDFKSERSFDIKKCSLVLRPLSDLTKQIEHNGERFIPLGKLHYKFCLTESLKRKTKAKYDYHEDNSMYATWYNREGGSFGIKVFKFDYGRNEWRVMRNLLKWHFDVFGLIDEGVAIDINTL